MNPFRIYVNGKCDTFINADHILKVEKDEYTTFFEHILRIRMKNKKSYIIYYFDYEKDAMDAFNNLFIALNEKENSVSFDNVKKVESW
jgi:predicted ATP-grasp superfamily ATP-dependent carboligase